MYAFTLTYIYLAQRSMCSYFYWSYNHYMFMTSCRKKQQWYGKGNKKLYFSVYRGGGTQLQA